MRYSIKLLLLACISWCSLAQAAQQITGRVVGVSDGDTITVLTPNNQQIKVRLEGIDAPEKSQDFGQRSKQSLSDKVYGKQAMLQCTKTDQYGRQICTVYVDRMNVNLAQVEEGMAWWYRHYRHEQGASAVQYEQAEQRAQAARRGLWADRNPEPPWEYRRTSRNSLPRF